MERISTEKPKQIEVTELKENPEEILDTFHTDEDDIKKFQKLSKNQQEFVLNFLTDIQQILSNPEYNKFELHLDIAKMLVNTPGSSAKYTNRIIEYREYMRFKKKVYSVATKINLNDEDRMLIFWNHDMDSYSVAFFTGPDYHNFRRT